MGKYSSDSSVVQGLVGRSRCRVGHLWGRWPALPAESLKRLKRSSCCMQHPPTRAVGWEVSDGVGRCNPSHANLSYQDETLTLTLRPRVPADAG